LSPAKNGTAPAADAALQAIATGQAEKGARALTLDNGIVLRLKPVPPMLVREAAKNIPDPPVPKVYIEAKGREESNPMDPAYLAAVQEANVRRGEAGQILALLMGTELESVPAGMYGPDDDGWVEEIRAVNDVAGITVEISDEPGSKRRYLDWLRLYAVSSETELFLLGRLVTIGVALTEQEVQAAAESFRRLLARGANLDAAGAIAADDGDPVPS